MLPLGIQAYNTMEIIVWTLIVTFAMIYVHERANVTREVHILAPQETCAEGSMKMFTKLYWIPSNPTGFSLAGIVVVDRTFIATMVGVLFSYGTFVLQLKENRYETAPNCERTAMNATKIS
ncbi:uncharacterized protein LOC129595572 [Paramacrobiotus metropolitanus]|uniref:uncharacterized protein LOC129595572 n=1 Tax=Paramacrobiotus metropolitanus TaxID=2943436 RepID=UPI002445857D|nr:uncharacterized protein LOC129595572 [Paramacrobiotus metropolitanus]